MKRIELPTLLFAALALAGCKKEKEEEKTPVDAPKTAAVDTAKTEQPAEQKTAGEPTDDKLIKNIEGCWADFAAWDKEGFKGCFAEPTEVGTVDGIPPDTVKTPQEVIVQVGMFRNAFADFKADLSLVLVNGHKAVAVGLLSGTHKGGSLGIPPTNKTMSLFYAQVIEANEQGRFVRERDYQDQATVLHQLGIQASQVAPAKEEPWADKVRAVAKNDDTEKANLAAFKSSFDARVKGDTAAATASYADDAVFRYMPEGQPYTGKKEIASATKADTAQHANLQGSVRDAWAAGNWVVAETTIKGTLARPLNGIKGTKGKKWEENSLELVEFAGGKVKRHIVFTNSLKFAVDVGLIDPAELGG
jgi:ketosteroid isomerase-like protein